LATRIFWNERGTGPRFRPSRLEQDAGGAVPRFQDVSGTATPADIFPLQLSRDTPLHGGDPEHFREAALRRPASQQPSADHQLSAVGTDDVRYPSHLPLTRDR
jgi:hypothetical protein